MQSFAPGPEMARAFRNALGAFGTGVTVVTCATEDGPVSMTANSFASVSLDPPLVLWSPAIASSRHDAFVSARFFSIHVLADHQLHVARHCASHGREFGSEWERLETGVPVLNDCLTRFDCRHHAAHGAGDHTILLGLVEQVTVRDAEPLLFVQGRYGGFRTAV